MQVLLIASYAEFTWRHRHVRFRTQTWDLDYSPYVKDLFKQTYKYRQIQRIEQRRKAHKGMHDARSRHSYPLTMCSDMERAGVAPGREVVPTRQAAAAAVADQVHGGDEPRQHFCPFRRFCESFLNC